MTAQGPPPETDAVAALAARPNATASLGTQPLQAFWLAGKVTATEALETLAFLAWPQLAAALEGRPAHAQAHEEERRSASASKEKRRLLVTYWILSESWLQTSAAPSCQYNCILRLAWATGAWRKLAAARSPLVSASRWSRTAAAKLSSGVIEHAAATRAEILVARPSRSERRLTVAVRPSAETSTEREPAMISAERQACGAMQQPEELSTPRCYAALRALRALRARCALPVEQLPKARASMARLCLAHESCPCEAVFLAGNRLPPRARPRPPTAVWGAAFVVRPLDMQQR